LPSPALEVRTLTKRYGSRMALDAFATERRAAGRMGWLKGP
jgi:hypothetical protein